MRDAAKKGLPASSVNPRLAAVGLHALLVGLIVNWMLAPAYLRLARDAKALVHQFLESLRAIPVKTVSRVSPVVRRARAEARD